MGLLSWLFKKKKGSLGDPDNTREAQRLLRDIYTEEISGVNNFSIKVERYSPQERLIRYMVKAPTLTYTRKKIEVVTATIHTLVLSELVYPFIYFLLRDRVIDLMKDSEFEELMKSYRLPFREFTMSKISKPIPIDEEYFVEIKLDKNSGKRKKRGGKQTYWTIMASCNYVIENKKGETVARGILKNVAVIQG